MPATVVVGLQWGDEGKGKTTDLLAESVVAGRPLPGRRQRRPHRGHRRRGVQAPPRARAACSIPHITPVIGPGVVVNPRTLLDEMAMLAERGIDTRARPRQPRGARDHALPRGARRGRRGAARRRRDGHHAPGHRAGLRRSRLADRRPHGRPARPRRARASKLARLLPERNALLQQTYRLPGVRPRGTPSPRPSDWGDALGRHITDTTIARPGRPRGGRARAARGRPGNAARPRPRHLPVRHEQQPDRRRRLHRRRRRAAPDRPGHRRPQGLLHARRLRARSRPSSTTRSGRHLLEKGREFGTTTGRRRRCGWFDAVPLRYAVAVNSVSSIMLNKLDILSGLPEVQAVHRLPDRRAAVTVAARRSTELERAEPVYETFPAGTRTSATCATIDDLPAQRAALRRCDRGAAPACRSTLVSVGPERTQTIVRDGAGMRRCRSTRACPGGRAID